MDLTWDGSTDAIYLLVSTVPHMVVIQHGEIHRTLDLAEVAVPGGMVRIPGDGGFYVSDRSSGLVTRFDRDGRAIESTDVAGRPGALALSGLDIWFVMEDEERVALLSDPETTILELPSGSSRAHLAGWGNLGVACVDGSAYLFSPYERPVELPPEVAAVCSWSEGLMMLLAGSGDVLLHPQDSIAYTSGDSVEAGLIAASPSGDLALIDLSGRWLRLVLR